MPGRGGFRVEALLKGSKEVQRELKRVADAAPKAVARALYQQGVEVWAEAVRRAPVEFGVLRTSGYAAPPQADGRDTYVEVGFGTRYAVWQHEKDYNHPRGGERYYLRNAAQAKATLEKLAAYARSNLEGGKGTQALSARAPARPTVNERVQARAVARKQRREEKRRKRSESRERAAGAAQASAPAAAPRKGGRKPRQLQNKEVQRQRRMRKAKRRARRKSR